MKSNLKDFDINKELYTVAEISKLMNKSLSYTYKIIAAQKINTAKRELKNNKIVFYYHKLDVYKLINLDVFIPVPKKEKKPYFEFAYTEYQSKMNV